MIETQCIARVCHDTIASYCRSIGDFSQPRWEDAPEWQIKATYDGIRVALDDPFSDGRAQHAEWVESMKAEGWVYGPVKNPARKQHPGIVAYDDMSVVDKTKDHLFRGVVRAFVEARSAVISA